MLCEVAPELRHPKGGFIAKWHLPSSPWKQLCLKPAHRQVLRALRITSKSPLRLKKLGDQEQRTTLVLAFTPGSEKVLFSLQRTVLDRPLSGQHLVSTITSCLWNLPEVILLPQKLYLMSDMDHTDGKRPGAADTLIKPTWPSLHYLLDSPLYTEFTWQIFKDCQCLGPTWDPTQSQVCRISGSCPEE